jgi:hypothetical protein
MPAFLYGKDLYADTYLWPHIVLYPLFIMQNFVVCCCVFDKLGYAAGEKKVAEHCLRGLGN